MPKISVAGHRLKSFLFAFKGLYQLLKTEANIKIQLSVAILVSIAGWYFDISIVEWIIQTLCIGMVMGMEGLNTAVEKLSDYVQPKFDDRIGLVKDMAAGAVLITALISIIIGCLIYVPKIF